ncbi:PREDICTED: uncharacterized protein LOC105457003 [Wasmannia auropunctata]|uniref:uncharacterized protein LOC105457003 n=1 Tax=Wasmannia auropunctata TaxID=64793 RepID=UPI0005EEC902|nr:PREDICTED: uncharacterized protein LOC105457003 [Wasmannia auropunctata]
MLFYAIVSAISVAVIGLSATEESTLPVTTCKRDSDDYSACLKRAVEKAWPRFMAGLPEFDFPPLDPLVYKYGRVNLNSAEIRGELIISNLTSAGVSKTRIFDVKAYFLHDVFHLEIDTLIPRAFLKGAVKINGSVNIFRVVNEGTIILYNQLHNRQRYIF